MPDERFWSKVNKDGPIPTYAPHLGQCWIWTAGLSRYGYGKAYPSRTNRTVAAYKMAYEWAHGPVPQGLELDHLCRVRACVRPSHLEAVTRQVNTLRGLSPAALNASKTHCSKGHAFDSANTYVWAKGRVCRACNRTAAARYKARRTTSEVAR